MIVNDNTLRYICQHKDDNVRQLALRGCTDPEVDFPFALQQILGRQKIKSKLPEYYNHPGILFPKTISLEQCSSSQTAHYKATLLSGKSIIDFSGGFGVDTLAFARKFEQCHYVEPQSDLCKLVQHNANQFNINNITYHQEKMENLIDTIKNVDAIYLDPSRRDEYGQRTISIEHCTPDISTWKNRLLDKAPKVLVKLSPMIDLKQTIRKLPETSEIHIVAVNGECKEILFLLTRESHSNRIFHTIDLQHEKSISFDFSEEEERSAQPIIAQEMGHYLYEPNSAVLKAGAFKSIATRYSLVKIHTHSHLYCSNQQIKEFPGRTFRVENFFAPSKKSCKEHLSGIKKANVAVRNFPLSAEALKQQLKLKDGGDYYLFGTTWQKSDKILILCHKI